MMTMTQVGQIWVNGITYLMMAHSKENMKSGITKKIVYGKSSEICSSSEKFVFIQLCAVLDLMSRAVLCMQQMVHLLKFPQEETI